MRKIVALLMVAATIVCAPLAGRAQITHASQGRLDENATEVLKKAAAVHRQERELHGDHDRPRQQEG